MTSVADGRWTTSPELWWEQDTTLHVVARAGSDFWRDPRTGSVQEDGHLLGFPLTDDASCEVEVSGDLQAEYDQCGMMLRGRAAEWVKVTLDVVGGQVRIATVVTNGHSDSALQPFGEGRCWFRLSRIGPVVAAEARRDARSPYEVIRLARLPGEGAVELGPVCCAPSRAGLVASFAGLRFGPLPAIFA